MDAARKIWELTHGCQLSGAMRAAVEVGMLHALDGVERTAGEIAVATSCPERGIRILADALVALGALEKHDARYRYAAGLERALSPSSPDYRGHVVLLATYPALYEAWGRASDAVKHGGTVLPRNGHTPGHEFWVDYARITAGFSRGMGFPLAEALAGTPPPARILDVGCGSGTVGYGFMERFAPNAVLVQNDWPNVLEIAREHASREPGSAATPVQLPGDALSIDLGKDYDLVLVAQFLQMFDPPTCVRLLEKLKRSLRPGGIIAICETPPDEPREHNTYALLFAMTMLLWTHAGDMYRYSDLLAMLNHAGFADVRRADVAGTPRSWIIARCPPSERVRV